MGRKSKLTDEQWAEVDRRLIEGESPAALAREFGVGDSTVRSRIARAGKKSPTVQKVAHMINNAQAALEMLPPVAQVSALNLAQRLRNVSESIAVAAENSARTAVRLSALANSEVQKVDDAEPTKNVDNLKSSVLLTKAANEAAHIPLNLLAANRDAVKRLNEEAPGDDEDDTLTPERMKEGVRKIAFILAREAQAAPENAR